MTGPEHYKAGEEMLALIEAGMNAGTADHAGILACAAIAQAHLTAALAAASAMETVSQFMGLVSPDSMGDDQVITEWAKATGWRTIVGATRFPNEDGPF